MIESDILDAYRTVSYQEAKKNNLKYYYGGLCKFNHDDLRYFSNNTCRECQRLRSRDYGRKNILKIINSFNKRTYGLDQNDIEKIRLAQNNCCALCNEEFKRTPHLDHCHDTNKLRGLLCNNCNTGLGLFKDDINKLKLAIKYLEKHNSWKIEWT